MIKFINAKLTYAGNILLNNISLTLTKNNSYGLVGRNGSGKTSILSLLLGKKSLDNGSVEISNGQLIACMEQEVLDLQRTAVDYVLDGDQQLRLLETQLAVAEKENNHNKIAHLHEELAIIEGYSAKARACQLLYGLGFKATDTDNLVGSFSGGWRMRLNLAKTLMAPATILLLDEPTNHLDLTATLWLESYLKKFPGMLIVISHDREFLDAITTHIMHIEATRIDLYTGNYSQFEQARASKIEQQQALIINQQQKQQKLQEFIDRFRAKASKAKQAQSKIKALEKLKVAATIYDSAQAINFAFKPTDKIYGPLIALNNVAAGYSTAILSAVNITILPESRIGIMGRNGAGKSTIIKTIIGEIAPLSGEITYAKQLKIGYFSQHQLESLDDDLSPLEQMQKLNPQNREQELKNFLGSVGFSNNKMLEKTAYFSGGEKARLALAIICWQQPNLLIFDEPTNHLDLEMRFNLTQALQNYAGALILVSHDRNFMSNNVDEFYVMENNTMILFNGDINDYKQKLLTEISSFVSSANSSSAINTDNKATKRKNAVNLRNKLKPLQNKIAKLELTIDKLQAKIHNNNEILADSELYSSNQGKDTLQQLLVEQATLEKDLASAEENWLQEQDNLEQAIQKAQGVGY